jgi:OOP family OmpA-OmpF porin
VLGEAANTAKAAQAQVTRIVATGHADRAGSDGYNMALSIRRANAVKSVLVREGVPERQIVVLGKGEREALVPTADGAREPINRRVEIVIE